MFVRHNINLQSHLITLFSHFRMQIAPAVPADCEVPTHSKTDRTAFFYQKVSKGKKIYMEAAANGEHDEWTDMYPRMAKEAREEGFEKYSFIYSR